MNGPRQGFRLRDQYPLHVEIGLVLALALLIVAFRIDFTTDQDFTVQMQEQEAVEMKEIQQTKQESEPPPPPKPPVPQQVPNNQVIEQETPDFDASLDMDERLDTGAPPPSPDEGNDESDEEPEIFIAVEESPDCGGIRALQKKVEYPPFARKAGIQGRVFVQFVVNEAGEVTRPTVTRGVHELLNKAAVNAVKRLDCTPGKQRGEPVKVRMSLPVLFKLKTR